MTNNEALELFREALVKKPFNKSTKTCSDYMIWIGYFLNYINNKSIFEVTKKDVKAYMQSLNVSDSTYNTYLSAIKCLYKVLAYLPQTEDYATVDPTFGVVNIHNASKKEKKELTLDEQRLMLQNCKNKRDYAILVVFIETGIRVNELINLTYKQYVNREENGRIKLLVNKGSHNDEYIYINEKCERAIEEYLPMRKEGCDRLFVSNTGEPMLRTSLSRTWKNIARRCGFDEEKIANLSNHSLRHSTACNLLNDGVDIDVVAEVLHHHNLNTVMVYAKTNEDRILKAVM